MDVGGRLRDPVSPGLLLSVSVAVLVDEFRSVVDSVSVMFLITRRVEELDAVDPTVNVVVSLLDSVAVVVAEIVRRSVRVGISVKLRVSEMDGLSGRSAVAVRVTVCVSLKVEVEFFVDDNVLLLRSVIVLLCVALELEGCELLLLSLCDFTSVTVSESEPLMVDEGVVVLESVVD